MANPEIQAIMESAYEAVETASDALRRAFESMPNVSINDGTESATVRSWRNACEDLLRRMREDANDQLFPPA